MNDDVIYLPPGEKIYPALKACAPGTPVMVEFRDSAYYFRVPKNLGCGKRETDILYLKRRMAVRLKTDCGREYRPDGWYHQMEGLSQILRPMSSPARIVKGEVLESKIKREFIRGMDSFFQKRRKFIDKIEELKS